MGWNRYWNKCQHRKSTLEKKILPLLLQGFEPMTFQSQVQHSNPWAIPAPGCRYIVVSGWRHVRDVRASCSLGPASTPDRLSQCRGFAGTLCCNAEDQSTCPLCLTDVHLIKSHKAVAAGACWWSWIQKRTERMYPVYLSQWPPLIRSHKTCIGVHPWSDLIRLVSVCTPDQIS